MSSPTTVTTATPCWLGKVLETSAGHAYADSFAHPGDDPYVKIVVKDLDSVSMLMLTPAQARELAVQLLQGAQFCEEQS